MRDDVDHANHFVPVRDTELQMALDWWKEASPGQTHLSTMNEREKVRPKFLNRGSGSRAPKLLEVRAPRKESTSSEPLFDQHPNVVEFLCCPGRERWSSFQDGIAVTAKGFLKHAVQELTEPLLDWP